MVLFLLSAGCILVYGAAYALFCMKKGGFFAALSVCSLLLVDLLLLGLVLYFRVNT